MGKIIAVCVSEKKGTEKKNVHSCEFIKDFGIKGDAHAGKWHRQVSLLSYDKIEEFKSRGAEVIEGAFGENLIVDGIDFSSLKVGTIFKCNEVVLELTQVGKECHTGCNIYQKMGDCIMPREGVFTRVLAGGVINEGDELVIISDVPNKPSTDALRVAVITSSDSGFAGEREDVSGPRICKIVNEYGYNVVHTTILPDDINMLYDEMKYICDNNTADLILTTGGTGFSQRDCMPEATQKVAQRMVPGIPEAMRAYSMQITKRSMLSRATCGIRKSTLILNLPGSPKAVEECLTYVMPELEHGLKILIGSANNCGR
ncbi:MOSC domain-containing protein [[Clostridium] fimetarium]|uniref:Molybdenum cofactor synthesis domain-containing protein n=1 Tax=[Clostridium] fimetarium TaxID=99656 RepID=A0A1I0RFN0_9FIRM|nr:MOSC domain-containing protein [[Clostridium] fimetarium]SEW39476.1 molybdenum cofactor synthesis domain-containing protein [[Clostridium] fimetarium]